MSTSYNRFYIIRIALVSALGGYLFGFDFAVITGALPFLQEQFHLNAFKEGLVTGSLAVGAILGCILAGNISEKYGRRKGLLIAAIVFGVSSLTMAFAGNLDIFIAMRTIAGIGVGMASMLSPMYIAEISPAHWRGRMVAIYQLALVIGILITNIVNFGLYNSGPDAWRWMFGLGAVPSLLFFLGALWLPESPRWLLKAGFTQKAGTVLRRIGGSEFATQSQQSILNSLAATNKQPGIKMVLRKTMLPAILIGIGLAVFQQLCGINVVFNYAPRIFESIGVSKDGQLLQTVFIGGINLIFTIVAMLLVDRLGRKPLMLIGAGGLAVLYIIVANMLAHGSPAVSWFLLSAIGMYAMTLAPVTWVLIAEIFPNAIRGIASSIAVVSLWIAYFILVFTFPILFERLQQTTFYVYSVICLLGLVLIFFKVKETRGKTLEEIEVVLGPPH